MNLMPQVSRALEGLEVHVTYCRTKQKYTVLRLTKEITHDLDFPFEDVEAQAPPRRIRVVDYFRERYGIEILHQHIPCLDLGKHGKINYATMEFCILVEGQIYPKEKLDNNVAKLLKTISLAPPNERKHTITEMVQANHGPFGVAEMLRKILRWE